MPLDHTAEDQCPTEPFPFACPCRKSSPSHGFEPIRAAALVISPKGLLSTWLTEFYSRVDRSHPLGAKLRMYVAHGEARSLINTLAKSLGTNLDAVPEKNDLETIRWDHGNQSPRYGSHHITVLTTSGSYDAHVASHVQREIEPAIINHRGKVIRKAIRRCDIVWGIIYRDEFHREKRETAQTPTLIHRINQNQPDWNLPTLWFLSGTPFEKGPSDLQAYLAVLEVSEWSCDPTFSPYTADKIVQLGKEFDKLIKHPGTPQEHRNFITKFSNLLALFMIRRTSQTDWFGQSLLPLPPHEARDVKCSIDPQYAEYFRDFQAAVRAKVEQDFHRRMQAWKAAGSKGIAPTLSVKNLVGASYKARICATFPYLIKLLEDGVVDLTWDEITRNKWHTNPEESPYAIHIDDIIRSGRKTRVIERILNMQDVDIHGDPEKLVVLSISPTIAFILWIVCHSELFCPIPCLSVMYH